MKKDQNLIPIYRYLYKSAHKFRVNVKKANNCNIAGVDTYAHMTWIRVIWANNILSNISRLLGALSQVEAISIKGWRKGEEGGYSRRGVAVLSS